MWNISSFDFPHHTNKQTNIHAERVDAPEKGIVLIVRSLFVIPDVSICHCSNHAKEEQGGISDLVADLSWQPLIVKL